MIAGAQAQGPARADTSRRNYGTYALVLVCWGILGLLRLPVSRDLLRGIDVGLMGIASVAVLSSLIAGSVWVRSTIRPASLGFLTLYAITQFTDLFIHGIRPVRFWDDAAFLTCLGLLLFSIRHPGFEGAVTRMNPLLILSAPPVLLLIYGLQSLPDPFGTMATAANIKIGVNSHGRFYALASLIGIARIHDDAKGVQRYWIWIAAGGLGLAMLCNSVLSLVGWLGCVLALRTTHGRAGRWIFGLVTVVLLYFVLNYKEVLESLTGRLELGETLLAQLREVGRFGISGRGNMEHNAVLYAFIHQGIPGALCLAVAWLSGCLMAWQTLHRKSAGPAHRTAALIVLFLSVRCLGENSFAFFGTDALLWMSSCALLAYDEGAARGGDQRLVALSQRDS